MAAHELPSAVHDHMAFDSLADRAAALAGTMTAWLTHTPMPSEPVQVDTAGADLVEWCRSARDVLAEVARG